MKTSRSAASLNACVANRENGRGRRWRRNGAHEWACHAHIDALLILSFAIPLRVAAVEWAGSAACAGCHSGIYPGLPDWLLLKTKTRQNDPAYLKYVLRFYGEIGRQLAGLFWKDGGPIVGVQIENEYHERGAGQGEEHILTLRKMARDAGLDAPFYSVTGWDDAAAPSREMIPVFGGYPDGFWYRPLTPLPPSPDYFFSSIRTDETVGDDLCSKRPDIDAGPRRPGREFPVRFAGRSVARHERVGAPA